MKTKVDCLSLKDKQKSGTNDISHKGDHHDHLSNLSLNQNHKCPILIPVKSCNKQSKNELYETNAKKTIRWAAAAFKLTDSTISKNNERQVKLKARDKPPDLFPNTLKFKVEEKAEKRQKKDKSSLNTSNSTLSLHIAAFENSVEAASSVTIKKWENKKEIFTASKFVTQMDPFEFSRQQNGKVTEPEVSHFRASQRLINPNEASMNGQQNGSFVQQQQQFPAQIVQLPFYIIIMQRYPLRQAMNFNADSSARQKLMDLFRVYTDVACSGNNEDSKEAQKFLEELCNNRDAAVDPALTDIIQNSDHSNSLYFATKVLTNRIVQNPSRYKEQYQSVWQVLIKMAADDERTYPNFVRTQFIKSAVTIVIMNFFEDAVVPVIENNEMRSFSEGPIFEYSNAILNLSSVRHRGALTIIEMLDEFLCQVSEQWRLNASLPHDHMLLIKKNLVKYSLWFFVELAVKSAKFVVQSTYPGNEKFACHLCEFLERAFKFSADENNPNSIFDNDCYHPPTNFNMKEITDLAFWLKRFIPEDEGLSLQSYNILIRLSYASGLVFGNSATIVSKFRKFFCNKLEPLLKTTIITPHNLSSVLSLLCTFTGVLYNEGSIDRSITDFSKLVASVLKAMVPVIVVKLQEGDDPEIRKIVRNFGQPIKYLAQCMDDYEDTKEIFFSVVVLLFESLFDIHAALDQSEDSRYTYETLVKSVTDGAIFFFKDFSEWINAKFGPIIHYLSAIQLQPLSNIQNLKAMSWYFYESGEIMRRSYCEDSDRFHKLAKNFYHLITPQTLHEDVIAYGADVENHAECLKAFNNALDGIFPDNLSQIDFISSSFSILLWSTIKFATDMKHDVVDLNTHNANLLSSSFWALKHAIRASNFTTFFGFFKPNNEFSSKFIEKLLNITFIMIAKYRVHPHVVEEAMAVIETMEKCGYFQFQMIHFLEFLQNDMTFFPRRRKLFEIGAKAACPTHVQHFIGLCLNPYRQQIETIQSHPNAMARIDPLTMIKIIEIFTGFADALTVFPEERNYGELITGIFVSLNNVYRFYQHYPEEAVSNEVVKMILKFVAVAVPSIMFYNIEATDNNLNTIVEMLFHFIKCYCQSNVQKWKDIDENPSNGNVHRGYDDLILLMKIVKDTLGRLQISCSSGYDDDDDLIKMIEHIGSLALEVFVPLMNSVRASVPDVLKAFSNMLHIITECNVMSVINFVKGDSDALFDLLSFILTSSQTPEYIVQIVTIMDFILQRHEIIFNQENKSWKKFLRKSLIHLFHIVITSAKEDTLYTVSRNCMFYFVYADLQFFKNFCDVIAGHHAGEIRTRIYSAFDILTNIDRVHEPVHECQSKFISNYGEFRRQILGILVYNPQDIQMSMSSFLT